MVKSIEVNGVSIKSNTPNVFINHKIYIPKEFQKVGDNKVVIEFVSSYVTNCEGFQYFSDPADNTEYIYTELEPDHCHIWFPCFD